MRLSQVRCLPGHRCNIGGCLGDKFSFGLKIYSACKAILLIKLNPMSFEVKSVDIISDTSVKLHTNRRFDDSDNLRFNEISRKKTYSRFLHTH